MWNSTCSLVSQWMPSTGAPVALVAVLASGGALGTGTPSGPFGPADGAGLSGPSVLSGVSFGDEDWLVLPLADEPPEVAASAMPTAAPPTITTAPSATSQRCRRRRRASAALASAIFWRACCCLFLLLLDTAPFPDRVTGGGRGAVRPRARQLYLLSTYVDSSMGGQVPKTGSGHLAWLTAVTGGGMHGFGDLESVIMHMVWDHDS